jgi:nucleoside triphosphate pyrophosphatase
MSKAGAPENNRVDDNSSFYPGKVNLWLAPYRLILASASASRRNLLASAGLAFDIDGARIDERAVEEEFLRQGGAPDDLAQRLARAKALEVARRNPQALCLGADQTLSIAGRILHKPADLMEAARQLHALAGRSHSLISAFCFARGGAALFESKEVANLTMRPLDERAIRLYLALAGPAALSSVGTYQVEGLGVHLFEKIEGDHATVLGLPMIRVLAWLRAQGCLAL